MVHDRPGPSVADEVGVARFLEASDLHSVGCPAGLCAPGDQMAGGPGAAALALGGVCSGSRRSVRAGLQAQIEAPGAAGFRPDEAQTIYGGEPEARIAVKPVSVGDAVEVAVIGGGPAGLMAAETAVSQGATVALYEAMASVGRKFLLAGKGGLNLTHAEPLHQFLSRYAPRGTPVAAMVQAFGPDALRQWARELGVDTFVGSSGRVFPADMKSAPLLRAWLRRLRQRGVQFRVRHRWTGWDDSNRLMFERPDGCMAVEAEAVVLALGGASWPQLGSDAAWVPILTAKQIPMAPLKPANCGFDVSWTEHFRAKYAGHPVKNIAAAVEPGAACGHRGDCLITETGLEGGVVYAVSAALRDRLAASGSAVLRLDLAPDRTVAQLTASLSQPRGKRTLATHLARRAGMAGAKAGLLREVLSREVFDNPEKLAAAIKGLSVTVRSPRPIAEAISTAGGVSLAALDDRLMLRQLPGVFCAGEMLDWEAPTGGYLLTACFATGRVAGAGAAARLKQGKVASR